MIFVAAVFKYGFMFRPQSHAKISFINSPVIITAIAALLFAYTIEVFRYFDIVKILGLQNSTIARIIIDTSFEWTGLLAYTLGIGFVMLLSLTSFLLK